MATGSEELTIRKRGVSLPQLLAGVSLAVAKADKVGVWTMVEVVELRVSSGHVFIGVSERGLNEAAFAKTGTVLNDVPLLEIHLPSPYTGVTNSRSRAIQ